MAPLQSCRTRRKKFEKTLEPRSVLKLEKVKQFVKKHAKKHDEEAREEAGLLLRCMKVSRSFHFGA